MRNVPLFLLILLLPACAGIQPQQFVGPNGRTAFWMRCSGMGRTLDACYKKAGEVCLSGYTIIDRASGTVAVPVNGGGFMAASTQPRDRMQMRPASLRASKTGM